MQHDQWYGPLEDIRVLALEQYGAGPFGTLSFADLGADVILWRWAAEQVQAGRRADRETGMAKVFCSEVALRASLASMSVHGGMGTRPSTSRALLPRRAAHGHRRRHERHPPARHRAGLLAESTKGAPS